MHLTPVHAMLRLCTMQMQRSVLRSSVRVNRAAAGRAFAPVRCMAAAPSHNPTAVTKKVYFDISIGGQPEGEPLAGTIALQEDACSHSSARGSKSSTAADRCYLLYPLPSFWLRSSVHAPPRPALLHSGVTPNHLRLQTPCGFCLAAAVVLQAVW